MSQKHVPVSVERGRDGTYTINFTERGKYQVSKCSCRDLPDTDTFLASSGETLTVLSDFPRERFVFSVTSGGGTEKFYVSERHIPMSGTPNFRDLGGIVNKRGRQVRWGKFFRSGGLSRLTETDLEYFKTLDIKTVIDLRSGFEAEREPSKFPQNYEMAYVSAPVGNPADFKKLIEHSKQNKDAEQTVNSVMMQGASGFVEILTDFKAVFDAMLSDKPFLFHCSAGKDRTGLAAALILLTLDVEREAVLEDYLLSNKYTVPYFTKYISFITEMGISREIAIAAAGVRREFLETTLDKIEQKYGAFDNMLSEIFGISGEIKNRIIEKYTY